MQVIRQKALNPTVDNDGRPNRKILVFTTFKDTAEYLYKYLEDLAAELGLNMAMVSGDSTLTTVGENNYHCHPDGFRSAGRATAPTWTIPR